MNRLEKVLVRLKEMNFSPDMGNFRDKLIIQKVVCLLELMGAELGYRSSFSLYVRGPYSPTLTKELYEGMNIIKDSNTSGGLTKKEKEQLSKLYEISDHLNPDMLEIMSTYGYLIKECNNDEKTAVSNLKRLKSFYPESKLAIGISKTKELFLKLSENEINDIKTEFKEWENTAILDRTEE
ncbi:MAG: hypothetical protein WC501_05130 [Candidatus Micrarchaeia archaeon]